MTGVDVLILILAAIAVGQTYYIWLAARRRPEWWRVGTPESERLIRELFAEQTHQVSRVVVGLSQDINGLRQELRAMAALPPETEIPRLLDEVRALRLGATIIAAMVLALAVYVWLAAGAPAWAWAA